MSHKKRYFVAVTLLDEEDKPTRELALLLRAGTKTTTFSTDDFKVAEAWGKKLREEYPEQSPIILEQIDHE